MLGESPSSYMPEDLPQTCGFSQFIHTIQQASVLSDGEKRARYGTIEAKVIFPPYASGAKVDIDSYRDEGRDQVRLSATLGLSLQDIQPAMGMIYDYIRNAEGSFEREVVYNVFWAPEQFQQEIDLTFSDLDIRISQYADVPGARRYPPAFRHPDAYNPGENRLDIDMKRNRLSVQTWGVYTDHIEEIFDSFDPNQAKISFSEKDANQLLASASKLPLKGLSLPRYVLGLRRKKMYDMGGGEIPYREMTVRADVVDRLSYILGKSLVHPKDGEQTRVLEWVKTFGLHPGDRLKDVQALARFADRFAASGQYHIPVYNISARLEAEGFRASGVRIPVMSEVEGVEIREENLLGHSYNSAKVRTWRGEETLFQTSTHVQNPTLLPLQEQVLCGLGLSFRQ